MSNPAEHQHYDIGVKAIIMHDDKLLLLKRNDYDVWEVPGGRINAGETLIDTLYREVPEELPGSRVVAVNRLLHAEQTEFTLPNGNSLMLLFYAVDVELPSKVQLSDEHIDIFFAPKESLPQFVAQAPVLHAAERAFEG
jgi:ADP-ribose pyrophosphatase YjhB (NUDIX family)